MQLGRIHARICVWQWEVHPDMFGKLSRFSQLVAFDHRITPRNAHCFEPLATDPNPGCSGASPPTEQVSPNCSITVPSIGAITIPYAGCLMHPARFARQRVFRGNGSSLCPHEDVCTGSHSLLLTSDASKCDRYNALADWACVLLPSPMRIYHGGTRPSQNAELAAVFSIAEFNHVVIEDLTLDVLPHPTRLGTFEELDADVSLNDTQRLEWLLPNHVQERSGYYQYSSTQTKYDNYNLGDETEPTHAERWAKLKAALPIHRRLMPTGAIFAVHDVENLVFQRANIRGLTSELMVQIRATRDITFIDNHLEGQPADRLKALGFPVDDPSIGLAALQPAYLDKHAADLSRIRLMGGGLGIMNGRVSHTTITLYIGSQ
jgi:hypothetical protein